MARHSVFLAISLLCLASLNQIVSGLSPEQHQACSPRRFAHDSFVCVCNATYCDSFQDYARTPAGEVTVFESDRVHFRFAKKQIHFTNNTHADHNATPEGVVVSIDRSKRLQSLLGFGGAFTDSAGLNILKLGPALSANIIKDYFGKNGLRYSMGRVPIGGSDFSTRPYTYDDITDHEDFELAHFKLAPEDAKYKIPLIKQAQQEATTALKLFASPWSAPAWMKTNNRLNGKGGLKGHPNGTYYRTWANYFVKFLDHYKANNVNFWGITLQNEPMDGIAFDNFSFNCMALTEEEGRDFIAQTLGPVLNASGYGPDRLKLMIADDQRPLVKKWADVVLAHREAAQYVAGIAFHWYLNTYTSPEVLNEVAHKYPGYFLVSSEACEGSSPFQANKVELGSWQRPESYAYDIIKDLQHHTSAWIDWNLALDTSGGPNWANNFVDAPIIINSTSAEYYKQPMYYALGHFARFLPPGSTRLATVQNKDDALEIVVFATPTPTNSTVAVVLNRFESTIPLRINDPRHGTLKIAIGGHSMQTLVWFD